MILTYWGPAFKKGASQFCFDFQQGQFLRLLAVNQNRKEACYRMRGTEVISHGNYSYATGIFISSNAQRNEVE